MTPAVLLTFSIHLWHRMTGGTPPESVTHTLFFLALLRLAQSPPGRQCLAQELQAVTATLMQGLDLDRPALRRTCLPVREIDVIQAVAV